MIRDHQRAVLAERHVREVSQGPEEAAEAYGAVCMKLPILVHQAGLAAALHHVAQLSKVEKRRILVHLAAQLHEGGLLEEPNAENLLGKARAATTPELVATTREVQRCLDWYRRFAKSILRAEAGGTE